MIYLTGGYGGESEVLEYNPRTNTWRNMPKTLQNRYGHNICGLENKIFVLGGPTINGATNTTCEMLDLNDNDPQWKYIASMNSDHFNGIAVVVEKMIYVLGGSFDTSVEVYDLDKGKFMLCFYKMI